MTALHAEMQDAPFHRIAVTLNGKTPKVFNSLVERVQLIGDVWRVEAEVVVSEKVEAMDFALSYEQQSIFESALAFGRSEILPHALAWEKAGTIPRKTLADAGTMGFAALCVPEEKGGAGLSRLDATLVFEALAMSCPSVAAFISIHNMCTAMIARHASAEVQEKHLSGLTSLSTICSYCLTEPDSGSDAAALRTKASPTPDGFKLNGSKSFISGAGLSDLYIVMCRTGDTGPKGISALVVENGTTGLSFGAQEEKMGWRAQPTAQVQLQDCAILASNLLGTKGQGFSYAMAGLDGGRLNIAACSLGGAQHCLDTAVSYMSSRKAFGKTLDQFQALQFRLADMETELQAARIFLRHAAWSFDTKQPDATKRIAMAKRFVTDVSFNVANQALQLLGGYGYLTAYGIEKIVRDLRVHQILEGTNEIMRVIIARAMLAAKA